MGGEKLFSCSYRDPPYKTEDDDDNGGGDDDEDEDLSYDTDDDSL